MPTKEEKEAALALEQFTSEDKSTPIVGPLNPMGDPSDILFSMPASFTMLFEKWMLPIFFLCRTYPLPGVWTKTVYTGWVTQSTLNVTLPDGADFPLSCKAYRRPMKLGPSKRVKGPDIVMNDPTTWPREARMRGVEHQVIPYKGRMVALCIHKPKCPPTLDFPGGLIMDNAEPWVMMEDREVLPLSEYQAAKEHILAERKARTEAALARQAALKDAHPKDQAAQKQLAFDALAREKMARKVLQQNSVAAPTKAREVRDGTDG